METVEGLDDEEAVQLIAERTGFPTSEARKMLIYFRGGDLIDDDRPPQPLPTLPPSPDDPPRLKIVR